MLGLKLNHVSKRGPWCPATWPDLLFVNDRVILRSFDKTILGMWSNFWSPSELQYMQEFYKIEPSDERIWICHRDQKCFMLTLCREALNIYI